MSTVHQFEVKNVIEYLKSPIYAKYIKILKSNVITKL